MVLMMTLSIVRYSKTLLKTQQFRVEYSLTALSQSPLVTIHTTIDLRTETLHSAHAVYLCVPYGSHNKQRLFP
jgi:NADH:ubiquinone oxidoreductase subunit C